MLDERAEATAQYEGVLAEHEAHKKNAVQALRRQEVQKNPRERMRLEALIRGPVPEHVGQAQFYLGVLQAEAGRFADAQGRFVVLPPAKPEVAAGRRKPNFAWASARSTPGQGGEAIRTLQPLTSRESPLDDQAFLLARQGPRGQRRSEKCSRI